MVSVPTQTLGCQPGVPRGSGDANANWSHIQGPWSTPKEILLWVIWVVRAMLSPLPGLFRHLCLFTSSPWLAGKQIASMFFRQKTLRGLHILEFLVMWLSSRNIPTLALSGIGCD